MFPLRRIQVREEKHVNYWVTQKLPQIYTENHATFPIRIRKITVQICGHPVENKDKLSIHSAKDRKKQKARGGYAEKQKERKDCRINTVNNKNLKISFAKLYFLE